MKHTLTELHNNYALVPVDKAAGNVSVIYRKFYVFTLIKELEWDGDTRIDINNTCNHIQEDLLIAKHSYVLCNNFHLFVNKDNNRIVIGWRNCTKIQAKLDFL